MENTIRKRYLLCIPRGGLNDTLCQIEMCLQYCLRYQRILCVNSTRSGLLTDFADYFFIDKPGLTTEAVSNLKLEKTSKNLSCFPYEYNQPDLEVVSSYDKSIFNYVSSETGISLSFDFSRDYEEDILVHEQCGGGRGSFELLRYLRLQKSLKAEILETVLSIPKPYDAIHVRNTDYGTRYKDFFDQILSQLNSNIFLSTDDRGVLDQAKAFFKGKNLYFMNPSWKSAGTPVHDPERYLIWDVMQKRLVTKLTLKELFLLSFGNRLFLCRTTAGVFSGFSLLAKYLVENPRIRDMLLEG